MRLEDYDATRKDTTYHGVDFGAATFDDCLMEGARFKNVDLRGVRIRGSLLMDVELSGEVERLLVNGVDVTAYVEGELTRRHPERTKMQPKDVAGFREAWDILERRWDEAVDRARRLNPELLQERVDGEWSFIETLRHLVFATDAWVRRAFLGDPAPWSPLDLPHDDMADIPEVPRDREVRPTLDEVLALRRDRMGTMRRVVEELTEEQLAGRTRPVTEQGYPEPNAFRVSEVLAIVVKEEWQHLRYATRDLAVLEQRGPATATDA